MTVRKAILLICILAGIVDHSSGQNRLSDTLKIQTATIRGQVVQSNYQTQKLDSAELQNSSDGNLADLLIRNSPVFIKRAAPGSLATISMRGTLASHTQVSWNGIKINSPMLGQVDFTLIPVFFTDQVQIHSGPGSILMGSGSFGGHIDLSSQSKWEKPLFGRLESSYGSFSTHRWMVDLGANRGKINSRIRLLRTQSKNDFPFLNTANGLFNMVKQENARYAINALLAQVFYRANSNNLIALNLWLQNSDRDLPPIMSYEGTGREEFQRDHQARFSGSWQYYNQNFDSRIITGMSLESMDYFLAHNTEGGKLVNYDTHSQSNSLYNSYQGKWRVNASHVLTIKLHADYHWVDIRDRKSGSGYTGNRFESGSQLLAEQNWTSQFSSYILIQNDYYRNHKSPIMPGIGFAYQILPGMLELTTSATRNFHLPTLNDLFWIPGGNPELLPEEGYLADIGFKTEFSRDTSTIFKAGLNGFMSYIDNWILWKPGQFQFWSPENLQTVLARGFETKIDIVRSFPNGKAVFKGHYTYTRTNQIGDPDPGPQLIYIPIHKANGALRFDLNSWFFNYDLRYTSERYTSTELEFSLHQLPAFSLHNLSIGKRFEFKKLNSILSFEANNIFNTSYQSILWRAMPGRNFNLNLKIDF
jgi:outer membrane cobalamin receptor